MNFAKERLAFAEKKAWRSKWLCGPPSKTKSTVWKTGFSSSRSPIQVGPMKHAKLWTCSPCGRSSSLRGLRNHGPRALPASSQSFALSALFNNETKTKGGGGKGNGNGKGAKQGEGDGKGDGPSPATPKANPHLQRLSTTLCVPAEHKISTAKARPHRLVYCFRSMQQLQQGMLPKPCIGCAASNRPCNECFWLQNKVA